MEAIFSEKEIMALQSQTWWTACSENPFLIKSSILETTILLSKSDLMKVITDLKIMWATRIDKTTLLMQK